MYELCTILVMTIGGSYVTVDKFNFNSRQYEPIVYTNCKQAEKDAKHWKYSKVVTYYEGLNAEELDRFNIYY